MSKEFSNLIQQITSSATVTLAEKARSLKDAGESVIDLTIGEPDFPTPLPIIEAANQAMRRGETKYTNSRGIPELRKAISKKLERDYHLTYSADSEIIATPGGKQGILYAVMAFINPGDEVLCVEPCWLGYESCIKIVGGKYVGVPTVEKDGFSFTEKTLNDRITPRTRMIIINSPSNPTGKVMSEAELEAVAKVCKSHDLICVSDDIYEHIVFDDHRFRTIAAMPGMKERTIVLNGFSKAYSMTGWRLAYLAAEKSIIAQINKLQQLSATCPSSISQWAGVEALNGPQDSVLAMRDAYQRRRDLVYQGFNNDKVSCSKTEGAFYAFVNIIKVAPSSDKACEILLEKSKLVTVPGSAFGSAGEGFVRLSFGTSDENLKKAIKNLENL